MGSVKLWFLVVELWVGKYEWLKALSKQFQTLHLTFKCYFNYLYFTILNDFYFFYFFIFCVNRFKIPIISLKNYDFDFDFNF